MFREYPYNTDQINPRQLISQCHLQQKIDKQFIKESSFVVSLHFFFVVVSQAHFILIVICVHLRIQIFIQEILSFYLFLLMQCCNVEQKMNSLGKSPTAENGKTTNDRVIILDAGAQYGKVIV